MDQTIVVVKMLPMAMTAHVAGASNNKFFIIHYE